MNGTTDAKLMTMRAEYVSLKKEYKAHTGKSDFDSLAKALADRMAASKNAKLSPVDWVYAARVIWNTTVPCKACGSTRCPDGCCCSC